MDNYLALHPHMLIDIEPTLGRRERPVSKQVNDMFREILEARERAREEAETESFCEDL